MPQGRRGEQERVRVPLTGGRGKTSTRRWHPTRMEENIENTYFPNLFQENQMLFYFFFGKSEV